MKLLLINQNPVVSRMMQMSAQKAGFDIDECKSVYDLPKGSYDVVIIDDAMYDENFLQAVKENISYKKLGLLTSSKEIEKKIFDFLIPKPFLPTDLLEILQAVKASIEEERENYLDEIAYTQENSLQGEETKPTPKDNGEKESIVQIEENEEESPFIEESLVKSGILDEEEIESVSKLLEEEPISEGKESEELTKDLSEPLAEEESEEENIAIKEPTQTFVQEDEKKHKTSPQEKELQKLDKHLDIAALKDLLDGMKIDISIIITFPDKKDV